MSRTSRIPSGLLAYRHMLPTFSMFPMFAIGFLLRTVFGSHQLRCPVVFVGAQAITAQCIHARLARFIHLNLQSAQLADEPLPLR